jgi:hypothetical protein
MEVLNNVVMTKEILDKGRSRNGAWGIKQIRILGLNNFSDSILRTTIGKSFPSESIKTFLLLKDQHLSNKNYTLPNNLFTTNHNINLDLDI